MKMYDAIYGNIYRETLWELNMEYMPLQGFGRLGLRFAFAN